MARLEDPLLWASPDASSVALEVVAEMNHLFLPPAEAVRRSACLACPAIDLQRIRTNWAQTKACLEEDPEQRSQAILRELTNCLGPDLLELARTAAQFRLSLDSFQG